MAQFWSYFRTFVRRWLLRDRAVAVASPAEVAAATRAYAAEAILPLLRRYLEPRDLRIADLGCGYGGVAQALAEENWVVGLDLDGKALACTRALAGDSFQVVRGAAEGTPFLAASFDAVLLVDVLEHVRSPEAALCEACRIARPGAVVLASFTPFWGPRGAHLWNYLPFPYVHYLIPPPVVERVVGLMGDSGDTEIAEATVRQYRELSKVTIRRFRSAARTLGFELLWERVETLLGPPLPLLPDLSAMEYTAVLRRRTR